jgi:CheY-like chemotaxis protein
MKVAVFENEYLSVKGAFSAANLLSFNNSLEIHDFASSQQADLTNIISYDVIFVDIDLSSNSELDGYSLISKLRLLDPKINRKIVILTGNSKVEESLKARLIPKDELSILIKPTDYGEIASVIQKIISKQ